MDLKLNMFITGGRSSDTGCHRIAAFNIFPVEEVELVGGREMLCRDLSDK